MTEHPPPCTHPIRFVPLDERGRACFDCQVLDVLIEALQKNTHPELTRELRRVAVTKD